MTQKIGHYITQYVAIREKKAELDKAHKDKLAPLNKALEQLENLFQKTMDSTGLDSLNGDAGTAYPSTTSSVTVSDKEKFLDYVRQNDLWHLLDVRPAKTAVNAFVEEQEIAPPGVNYTTITKINVRKS